MLASGDEAEAIATLNNFFSRYSYYILLNELQQQAIFKCVSQYKCATCYFIVYNMPSSCVLILYHYFRHG